MSAQDIDRVNVVPLIQLSKAGKAYTYGVPPALRSAIAPGVLVTVPFRNRQVPGIVVDLTGNSQVSKVLSLTGVEDQEPVLLPYQLQLAGWISSEYAAPLSDVLSVMLPPPFRRSAARRSMKPDLAAVATPAGVECARSPDGLKRSPAQRELLRTISNSLLPIPLVELLGGKRAPNPALKALEGAGLITLVPAAPDAASPLREPSESSRMLSPAQREAAVSIQSSLRRDAAASPAKGDGADEGDVFLLYGVTGSGKTEVYMTVIQEALRRGQDAMVLVPEISLTPQAVERFTDRFPGLVAALHSRMAAGEREGAWRRLRSGQARIAIGPRSAVFAPLHNLGVIILDEEHDASYKQEESPRYHARDVAIRLAGSLGIPVILGSATPDVASFYHARKGRYRLLTLPDRPVWAVTEHKKPGISDPAPPPSRPMPSVEIVDLRQELKAGHRGIFSRRLLSALDETMANGHQALLFLNRRGSATSVLCRDCGHVAHCLSCDIPLTFHSVGRSLVCHRCDRRYPTPTRCPSCGGGRIRFLGVGTQRVADEVIAVLPQARVLRWDRDATSKKGAHERIASAFARHEADILVGTQMIAKGLDFPLVTLVGVIVADVGINLPDFRAAERTFQLLTQVAGRAGRADLPSQVIIQAYNPDHYALRAAKGHDYWSFYRQEMTFRHASGYPPFSRLVRFLIKGKNDMAVGRKAHELRDLLAARIDETPERNFELIGPAPTFTARVNDVFQWHLLVRGQNIHELLSGLPDDITVDIDPVDLL